MPRPAARIAAALAFIVLAGAATTSAGCAGSSQTTTVKTTAATTADTNRLHVWDELGAKTVASPADAVTSLPTVLAPTDTLGKALLGTRVIANRDLVTGTEGASPQSPSSQVILIYSDGLEITERGGAKAVDFGASVKAAQAAKAAGKLKTDSLPYLVDVAGTKGLAIAEGNNVAGDGTKTYHKAQVVWFANGTLCAVSGSRTTVPQLVAVANSMKAPSK